ncbi:hypothetical protein C8R42DRAFT_645911 [Lentinula raphanica]|nr:hypothetical protein C8R42DRAFT_645911 [Lentinula raphanica]
MPTSLSSLPVEVLEHIAFYYVCPRVLGPPVPLTTLLLLSKTISYKLSEARHLYARVFKHKFSSNAIRRRGFEPRVGEWASQLRWWLEVLKGVRNRRRRPGDEAYLDDIDAEEVGVSETMYALWIMCLEDNGCNRAQMQLAGVYEWVEGYIRTEMYKNLDKGWPLANAENSCAMWIFWYLSSKARLMEETPDQRESLVQLVLPFVTVPFRYPSAFAPANHFRLPLRSAAYSSSSTPFSIPTPHGPYPIYLHPNRHTWLIPHFDRWTALSTPLASDAAKLVYFSRRELMLFNVPPFLPPNREDHRARVRARLAAENNGEVDEARVQMVFRSELPRPTQEDFEELNAGLLGGDMFTSSTFLKGGGTPLPREHDPWDDIRKTLPNILDVNLNSSELPVTDLDQAERMFGDVLDEKECTSSQWDADWWRLRLCRSAWAVQGEPDTEDGVVTPELAAGTDTEANVVNDEVQELYDQDEDVDDDEDEDASPYTDSPAAASDSQQNMDMVDEQETNEQVPPEQDDSDMQRDPTMFTGYPQQGAVYTPGQLNGLWTGRMIIPSETHLHALLLPPGPNQQDPMLPANDPPAAPEPHGHPPVPNQNNDGNGNPAPHHPHNADPSHNPVLEAGHRPNPFNEDTLRLAAVPLYVRFSEYAIYSGGTPIPCANDTDLNDDIPPDNAFDQGIRDAWFPPNAKLSANPDRLTVSVPSSGLTNREDTYEYVAIKDDDPDADKSIASGIGSEAEARSKRKPGTFHDRDTCPGCKARENALETARAQIPVGVDARSELLGNSQEQDELPPYVPSVETIPPCNGIRDVVITGSTDPRHAAAWGDWVWRGRVRKWDGMVGLVRSVNNGPNGSSAGNGGGKIFFYGTVIRGKNLVGTWRLAHEDPRMPAYEGAFTLGRKDE